MKSSLNSAVGSEASTAADLPVVESNDGCSLVRSDFEMGIGMPSSKNDVRRLLEGQTVVGFTDISSVDDPVLMDVISAQGDLKVRSIAWK